MYGQHVDGQPFQVFARRESLGAALVLRFECREGMGFLGLRKAGRNDPPPAPTYEEGDVDPAALRAGRFVHVLPSGQRQSYALSRLSADITGRMPSDRWVELRPHTEYGFRYLVAPERDLDGTVATVAVGRDPESAPTPSIPPSPHSFPPTPSSMLASRDAPSRPLDPAPIPAQAAVAPALADLALRGLSREQALEHLRGEMAKVASLQQRVSELEATVERSRARELDLLAMLTKWSS